MTITPFTNRYGASFRGTRRPSGASQRRASPRRRRLLRVRRLPCATPDMRLRRTRVAHRRAVSRGGDVRRRRRARVRRHAAACRARRRRRRADGKRFAGSFSSSVMIIAREIRRHVGAPLLDRHRPLGDVLDENRRRAVRDERRLAGEHLVAEDAERVEIAASVDRRARPPPARATCTSACRSRCRSR